MARQITLTKPTLFRHGEDEVTLPPGTTVEYERDESPTEVVHTARRYADGAWWTSQIRERKASAPTPTAPTNGEVIAPAPTESLAQETARDALASVTIMAEREVERETEYMGEEARKAAVAHRTAEIMDTGICRLTWYIPDELGDIRNPRRDLIRYGGFIPNDGSNGLIRKDKLTHPRVKRALDRIRNGRTIVIPSPVEGAPSVVIRARVWEDEMSSEQLALSREGQEERINEALYKMHTSLIERLESASQALKKAQEAQDGVEAANDKYAASIRTILRDAIQRFETALQSAELYDNDGKTETLFSAYRAAVQTQALAVNAYLASQKRKEVKLPNSLS